jgi:sterol desaturase/sphingolipid hydroxylase (fatty acid hydroxylase superfamily)
MRLITLEHSKATYVADFAFYITSVLFLSIYILTQNLYNQSLVMITFILIGIIGWTAIEYLFHRFILHGIQPFQNWHTEHHKRPRALICLPTALSAALIVTFIFLPALLVWDELRACALTLGLLIGYLAYTAIHHATHHWQRGSNWLDKRKHWHIMHHHVKQNGFYGVTSSFWDFVFNSNH